MLSKKKATTLFTWTLALKKCGLLITLQQFKMKVEIFTNEAYTILERSIKEKLPNVGSNVDI